MALSAFAVVCNAQEAYKITGNTQGFSDGATVRLTLAATHENKPQTLAEGVIQNNAFTLTGTLEEPRLCMIRIDDKNKYGVNSFMIKDGNITVNIVQGDSNHGGYVMFKKFTVEGSDIDKEFRKRAGFRDTLDSIYNDYNNRGKEIRDKVNAAKRSGNAEEVKRLQSTDAYKTFEQDDLNFFNLVEKTMFEEFKKNGDSFWGPLLVLYNINYFTPNDPKFTSLYEGFSDEAKNSFYGKLLKKQIYVEGLAGKANPGFSLPDRDDKVKSFTELSKGKKLVLIDFWASWCNPCRKSIPQLKEIYKDLASKGLEIISVSIDKKKADWVKALDAEQLPWPCVLDTQDVFGSKYNGRAVPTFVLVDANGIVISDMLGVGDLRAKISSLLSK